ncbi:hypothetical protein M8J76_015794 [Diaphorina citri]|nr:hypothetical protein M8J76_015794 [Diaphorina citri]
MLLGLDRHRLPDDMPFSYTDDLAIVNRYNNYHKKEPKLQTQIVSRYTINFAHDNNNSNPYKARWLPRHWTTTSGGSSLKPIGNTVKLSAEQDTWETTDSSEPLTCFFCNVTSQGVHGKDCNAHSGHLELCGRDFNICLQYCDAKLSTTVRTCGRSHRTPGDFNCRTIRGSVPSLAHCSECSTSGCNQGMNCRLDLPYHQLYVQPPMSLLWTNRMNPNRSQNISSTLTANTPAYRTVTNETNTTVTKPEITTMDLDAEYGPYNESANKALVENHDYVYGRGPRHSVKAIVWMAVTMCWVVNKTINIGFQL